MTIADAGLPLAGDPGGFSEDRLSLMTPCARMADIRTVICGQSHNTALWRAILTPADDGRPTRAMEIALRFGLASLPRPKSVPDYDRAVAEMGRDRNAVLIWGGNQANADFLLAPGRPIDVVPRGYGDTEVAPDAQVVPESALRAHFAPSVSRIGEILGLLGRPPGRKRIVLGIQPPLPDDQVVRRHLLKRKGYFFGKSQELSVDPASVPILRPPVRRKLWFVLMEMYREEAERHGALFLPFPPAAADAAGYLKPAFSAEDGTHANVQYGRLMIEHLAPHLD